MTEEAKKLVGAGDAEIEEMKPSFQKGVPIGLCLRTSGCKSREQEGEGAVKCALRGGAEVVRLRVCQPWAEWLLTSKDEMAAELRREVSDSEVRLREAEEKHLAERDKLEKRVLKLEKELANAESVAIGAKSEVARLESQQGVLKVQAASACQRAEDALEDKHEMWRKMREAQDFISEKAKHDKKMARLEKKLEQMDHWKREADAALATKAELTGRLDVQDREIIRQNEQIMVLQSKLENLEHENARLKTSVSKPKVEEKTEEMPVLAQEEALSQQGGGTDETQPLG